MCVRVFVCWCVCVCVCVSSDAANRRGLSPKTLNPKPKPLNGSSKATRTFSPLFSQARIARVLKRYPLALSSTRSCTHVHTCAHTWIHVHTRARTQLLDTLNYQTPSLLILSRRERAALSLSFLSLSLSHTLSLSRSISLSLSLSLSFSLSLLSLSLFLLSRAHSLARRNTNLQTKQVGQRSLNPKF